jgi:hypothetical protein
MKHESERRKVGRPLGSKRTETGGKYPPKFMERFWARVNKNGTIPKHYPELGLCWEWLGGGNGKGYGQVRINYRQVGTHQAAWELMHGAIPKGLWVLHKCDNRACCNPDHLFLGTAKDNAMDMSVKGRHRGSTGFSTGTKRHHISNHEVKTVRMKAENGSSFSALAREYDVSKNTISNIVNGKTRRNKK